MTGPTHRIVLTEPFSPDALERLARIGEVIPLPSCDAATVKHAIVDCDALLVRTATVVDRPLLQAANKLKVVGRGGVGIDNIDIEATKERGIAVVYTPTAGTESVADLTLGFLISLVRKIRAMDAAVRERRFVEARSMAMARELHELTIGIIGMGRIGQAVARRCRNGFGMRVLYNDIVPPGWLDFVAEPRTKESLYADADVVSLHVPLTSDTRDLINAKVLALFKPAAFLINTARGALVDAAAVVQGLSSGRLAGFATDVFDIEPPAADHPLLGAPNTLFTPHVGAKTHRAQQGMNDVVDDVIRVLKGDSPKHLAW